MVRHLLIVATGFRLAGLLLALASIAALVDLADTALVMRRIPPPETGAPLDIGTYGLVALIVNTARGADYLLHALAGVASFMLVMLAVAAVLTLLLGALLFLTGRGIGHHAAWARTMAMLLSSRPRVDVLRRHGGDAARPRAVRRSADRRLALHALGCDLALRLDSLLEHDLFRKPVSTLGSSPRAGFFGIML